MMQSRSVMILAAIVALATVGHAQKTAVVIKAAHVYPGDGSVIENGTVVIRGGKILAVGRDVSIPAGAELLDAGAGSVTPGLIDAASPPRRDSAEHISEVTPQYRALDSVDLASRDMRTLAREGVTTICRTGDPASVIAATSCVVKTGDGIDGRVIVEKGDILAPMNSDPEGRGLRNSPPRGRTASLSARRPTTKMGTVFVFRDAFRGAMRFAAGHRAGLREPDAAYQTLLEVLRGRRGLRFLASQESELSTTIHLAREFGIKRYTIQEGLEVYRLLAPLMRAGASVIYGPVVDQNGKPIHRVERSFGNAKFHTRARLSTPAMLKKTGIPFCITAGTYRGDSGLARQAMYAMRGGLDFQTALISVTSAAAKILGIDDRVGLLKKGMDADIVVWSGRPLEATSRQDHVFINGRRVDGRTF